MKITVALDIDTELAALEKASGLDEKHQGAISKHSARLAAAVQLESASMVAGTSEALRESIDKFTAASGDAA